MAELTPTTRITFRKDNPFSEEGHAAINVKWYGPWPDGADSLAESVKEIAYERAQEYWWARATSIAHEKGYSGVFSEGRSGGWLIPYRQLRPTDLELQRFTDWPGQGPKLGYPIYPDMYNASERYVFVTFRREIETILEEVPDMLGIAIEDVLADNGPRVASYL